VVAFQIGWKVRKQLRSGIHPIPSRPLPDQSGEYIAGKDCVTCDVFSITMGGRDPSTPSAITRVHFPADRKSGLGLVMLPHGYHPRGIGSGFPACSLGHSSAMEGAIGAWRCRNRAIQLLLPNTRMWSRALWRARTVIQNLPPSTQRSAILDQSRMASVHPSGRPLLESPRQYDSQPDRAPKGITTSMNAPESRTVRDRILSRVTASEKGFAILLLPSE